MTGKAADDKGRSYGAEWRRGALAMAPIWAGVAPFGLTYAVLARQAGFSALETQLLSLLVFAGSAQMAAVTLLAAGAGAPAIVLTGLVLNLRHILYGLSLAPDLPPRPRPAKPLLALLLVDESYGLAIADARRGDPGRRTDACFWGAATGLYVVFNLATAAGIALGALLPNLAGLGIEFVFPVSFLVLLLPLLRRREQLAAALLAAALVLALRQVTGPGQALLGATVVAAALGAGLERRRAARPAPAA